MASGTPVKARLEEHLPDLRRRYGVGRIQIYGSVARGEEGPKSDIDLLVEFVEVPSLFDIVRLQEELEDLLGRPVDIATPGGMHPRILANARREAIDVGA